MEPGLILITDRHLESDQVPEPLSHRSKFHAHALVIVRQEDSDLFHGNGSRHILWCLINANGSRAKFVSDSSFRPWGKHPIVIGISDALIGIYGLAIASGLTEVRRAIRRSCEHRCNCKERKVVMHIMTWMAAFLSLGWLCYAVLIKSKMNMQKNYIKQLEADVAELRKIVTAV